MVYENLCVEVRIVDLVAENLVSKILTCRAVSVLTELLAPENFDIVSPLEDGERLCPTAETRTKTTPKPRPTSSNPLSPTLLEC